VSTFIKPQQNALVLVLIEKNFLALAFGLRMF